MCSWVGLSSTKTKTDQNDWVGHSVSLYSWSCGKEWHFSSSIHRRIYFILNSFKILPNKEFFRNQTLCACVCLCALPINVEHETGWVHHVYQKYTMCTESSSKMQAPNLGVYSVHHWEYHGVPRSWRVRENVCWRNGEIKKSLDHWGHL